MKMTKICNKCGRSLEDSVNFCPNCKSTSFRNKNEIVQYDTPVHRLLYWNYDGKYAISKSKVTGIVVFLIFSVLALASGAPAAILLFAAVFGILTYIIGFGVHQMISRPSQTKLEHNDYGLLTDLKHFFFYWQNRQGQYVLSKTKIISHLIFLMFFSIALSLPSVINLFVAVLFGVIFEIPVFFVGYGIHKLANPNPEAPSNYIEPSKQPSKVKLPKKLKPKAIKSSIIPEYMGYVTQLDELNSKFKSKEKSTRDLIEKRFEPPQLTYTRFIGGVDKSAELFKIHSDAAYSMINLADEYSSRIAGEIESKIDILNSINEKMDNLANELVLSGDISKKEDVDNVMGEMDNLIDSVKDYE